MLLTEKTDVTIGPDRHQGKVLLHEGKIYGNNKINNFNAL